MKDCVGLTTSQKTLLAVPETQPIQQKMPLLLLLLCLSEALYLLLLALVSLSKIHTYSTPISAAYPWTLIPMHLLLSLTGNLLQTRWTASAALLMTIVALLAVYIWAINYASRRGRDTSVPVLIGKQGLLMIIVGALLFGLTLLFQAKLLSDDVFTYIFSGRILVVYGADPLNTAPTQYIPDPYLQWVISGRSAPNIYGPLWLCISALLVSFKANAAITLLLFKSFDLLMHLFNCVLVWAILSKLAPTRRFLGTLLYAWNPLVLLELAGSGHSEGALLFLLLLTTWVIVQGTHIWGHIAVCILFGFAISINLIALVAAPLYIWFDLRTHKSSMSLVWGCCWRVLLMLLPAMAISLPFWRGTSTFFAITSAIDMAHFVHSPVGVLAFPLRAAFLGVDDFLHFPSFLQPFLSADITLRATATLIFVLIYANLFTNVRQAPTTFGGTRYSAKSDPEMTIPGIDVLLSSWGTAVFWYMILVSGWFWPWYMLWMLWAVVLRRLDAFTKTVIVLSGTSLLLYPLASSVRGPFATYQPALIFGIPLLYLIIVSGKQRRIERTQAAYDGRGETT